MTATKIRDGKYIIRTSDRGLFKRCRRQWNYASKIREHFEPAIVAEPLEFGTAIHAALEVWYGIETWDTPAEVRAQMAEAEFLKVNSEQRKAHGDNIDAYLVEQYHDRKDLGVGMLRNFFSWAVEADREWKPVLVEQEFEVPVIVPMSELYNKFDEHGQLTGEVGWENPKFEAMGFSVLFEDRNLPVLYYQGAPVVYQGRIDLAVEIDGEVWIVDHKTAASFKETMPELDVDTQVTSYAWAAQFYIDKPIAGVIYQQLKKAYPQPPRVLSSGKLSKDKSQGTTAELYIKAVTDHNLNLSDYAEFINYLHAVESEGNPYFRRLQLHRSSGELKSQQEQIFYEAVDMVGNPALYPNPGWSTCPSCPFKAPCLADNDFPGENRGVEMLEESPDYERG